MGASFLSASLHKRSLETWYGGGTRPFAAVRVQTGDYPILGLLSSYTTCDLFYVYMPHVLVATYLVEQKTSYNCTFPRFCRHQILCYKPIVHSLTEGAKMRRPVKCNRWLVIYLGRRWETNMLGPSHLSQNQLRRSKIYFALLSKYNYVLMCQVK